MDEIKDKYYDLEDFINDLEELTRHYKNKIDNNYIEQIEATYCEAIDEKEELEEIVKQIEEKENKCLEFEYERCRV